MMVILRNTIIGAIFLLMGACAQTNSKPTLFMIGDSTMANKPDLEYPERGWGQILPTFFDTTKIEIQNHAQNGRSSRSFIYESRWDTVMSRIKPGDFVIIQFGHNDDVITKTGRQTSLEEFRYNCSKFVKETQQKGANPILCTPIVRRNFVDSLLVETHGGYPDIIRQVSAQFQIPLIDMHAASKTIVTNLGVNASIPLYLHIEPGKFKKVPDGKIDDTHASVLGATTWAEVFVDGIIKQNLELATYLLDKKE